MFEWFGFLNLNKPAGWTSRQAVDHVKRLVKPAKIGHAGTLDPLATGVLVLCVGPATRLVPYLHDLPKSYRAEFLVGHRSVTDDTEGDVERVADAPRLSREQIEAALPNFVGRIKQVPPAYSAVKIRGRRAYDLARRGKSLTLEPRLVDVHSIRLLAYEHPRLEVEIVCGSGTYIRSVGRDLAESLGTFAVMSGLVRTRVGPFTLADAHDPVEINAQTIARALTPPQFGLHGMPQVVADEPMLDRLQRGLRCPCPSDVAVSAGTEVAVLAADERLILIATLTNDGRELQPRHVFWPKRGRL